MKETVEHNNRFYGEELKTESEQLKEWLLIANESNDYFREENERLQDKVYKLEDIIKEVREYIEKPISLIYKKECGKHFETILEILNKVEE